MSIAGKDAHPRGKSWLLVSIIGLVAVIAGTLLPQMLPPLAPITAASETPATTKKDNLAYTPPAWPEGPDPKAMILRLVLGTALVLGLCVGTLWFSKRWLRGAAPRSTTGGALQLVDTLHLGQRCCVHLVAVGRQQILVGADAAGVKTIVPLSESFADALGQAQEEPTA